MNVPDFFDDLGAATHLAFVAQQKFQEGKFLLRQADLLAVLPHLVAAGIQGDLAQREHGLFAGPGAQLYFDPLQQFRKVEGLFKVVVGASLQPEDGFVDGVPGRKENDGRSRKGRLALPANFDPTYTWHHPVEQQQVVFPRQGQLQARVPLVGHVDGKGFILQSLLQEFGDAHLVFYD